MELDAATLSRLAQTDPDRVRAAQLAKPADRAALMVLYAFHAELARIPESVSQPLIGNMRYQFWRDAVDEIYVGKPPRAHEVVAPLSELIRARDLPRFWIDRLIDARERDLDPRPFADMDAARDYSRATSATLMQLAVKILGSEDSERTAALGEAWGLTGLARAYRFYKGSMLQHLTQADLVAEARAAYARGQGKIAASTMPAVAYAAFVPLYARAMSRPGHDAAKGKVEVGDFAKQRRLMRVALTGRVK